MKIAESEQPLHITQREQVLSAYEDGDLESLRTVLDEAQHEPPVGIADGSIRIPEWKMLRAFVHAHEALENAEQNFRTVWRIRR